MSPKRRGWAIRSKDTQEDFDVERANMLEAFRRLCRAGKATQQVILETSSMMRRVLMETKKDDE